MADLAADLRQKFRVVQSLWNEGVGQTSVSSELWATLIVHSDSARSHGATVVQNAAWISGPRQTRFESGLLAEFAISLFSK